VQAGPDNRLAERDIDDIVQSFNNNDFLAVNVHQAQTLEPSLIENNDLTFEQAIALNTETLEILYKVITYFKEEGRKVYVFGQSFGAFVTQDLIAKKGIDVADKYLIMIGRLDMEDVMWQAFSEGGYGFYENGVTPILGDGVEADVLDRNLNRLAAGFAMNKYTQSLNSIPDLSKITYYYGKTDEAVGSLTPVEVEFLEAKNVFVTAGEGGHDETIGQYFFQGFKVAFGIE